MKQQITISITLLLISVFASAQSIETVPFQEIKKIADKNAQAYWGDVYPSDPIPYYGLDEEIIAWRFNYSIGGPFPSQEQLLTDRKEFKESGNKRAQWGAGKFGRLLVAARPNLPVMIESSACLSPEYAEAAKLEKMLKKTFNGQTAEFVKVYYFDHFNTWYKYRCGDTVKFINLSPTGGIIGQEEFEARRQEATYFIQPDDFSGDWQKYLDGFTPATDAAKYIPYYQSMPFYDWSYGCTPTAAAMLLAYWDVTSLFESWKYAGFVQYHYQRWDAIDNGGEWDYNVANLQLMLALAMDTDTLSGTTMPHMMDNGYKEVCNDILPYSFNIGTHYSLHWTRTKEEIDAGRPLHIDISGHSVCAIGYNSSNNKVYTHYTWEPEIVSISRWSMLHLVTVHPGGSTGDAVYLRRPFGDRRYNDDGDGEDVYEGDFYEILWAADKYYGTTSVDLFYSTTGGLSFNLIEAGAENCGYYNWEVPSGVASDDCRVMVYLQDTEFAPYIAAADGSWGNFKIHEGGFVPFLHHSQVEEAETEAEYYRFEHAHPSWAIVGAFPETSNCRWSCELWDEDFDDLIMESYHLKRQNFVVLDGNHLPTETYGIKVRPHDGDTTVYVQYEGDNDELTLTPGATVQLNWQEDKFVEMRDIHLAPGYYYFEMYRISGNMDVDMAFFSSTDGNYYSRIWDADYISENYGNTKESFVVDITEEDDYGICFFLKERGTGNGMIGIKIDEAFIWTGDVSNNWHDPDNWVGHIVPNAASKVVIGDGPNDPRITGSDAVCGTLNIQGNGNLRIMDHNLTINNNLNLYGDLYILNTDSRISCYGDVLAVRYSYLEMTEGSGMYVHGDWTFDTDIILNLNHGFVNFTGDENSLIYIKSDDCRFFDLKVTKTDGAFAAFDMCPGGVYPLRIGGAFQIEPGAIYIGYSMNPTILDGTYLAYIGSQVTFPNGKITFNHPGPGGPGVYSSPGSYFNNVEINVEDWVVLSSDIEIRGNLTISDGVLKANGHDIYIKGSWTNNSGFNHGNARVIFTGSLTQQVNGENFYELEIDKFNGELRFHENYTSVQHLDWTQGTIRVNGGEFEAFDLLDNGIYGNYILTAGQIDLHQGTGSGEFIDLNGSLEITGGVMNIHGGVDDSYWPYSSDASLTMSDGVLDFRNRGIRVYDYSVHNFTENITGGTIRISQGLDVENDTFTPTGGTVFFYNYDDDAEIDVNEGSNLFNLTMDKSSKSPEALASTLTAVGTLNINGDFTIDGGNFEAPGEMYIAGNFNNNLTPAHFDELVGNVIFDGEMDIVYPEDEIFYNLTIDKNDASVVLPEGQTISVTKILTVDNGQLICNPGSSLLIDGGVSVNNGGGLYLPGGGGDAITVTSLSKGDYVFDVNAGGQIAAENVEFSNMDTDGVNIHSGAYLPGDWIFKNCTFKDGALGGTLITWDNGADIVIYDAVFPTNTTGSTYNVTKNADNGYLHFDNATGDFAGEAFENDLYDRVNWEYVPPFTFPFLETWDSGSFETNRWTATGENWAVNNNIGNPEPSAKFSYSPRVFDYNLDLRTHFFDATDYETVILSYDILFDEYQSQTVEELFVRVVFENGDFYTVATYDNQGGGFGWTSETFDVSGYVAGEIFKVFFRAHGQDSWYLNGWYIDNISLSGELPAPGDLSGKVYDETTNELLVGAFVQIEGTAFSATTNSLGKYLIEDIPPGNYDVTASFDGYGPKTNFEVEVPSGGTGQSSFYLPAIPPSYCTDALYTAGCDEGDGLDDFILVDIQNLGSGCSPGGYGDFTFLTTDLAKGYMYPLEIMSNYQNQFVSVWIDFNDNLEFEEGERLLTDFHLLTAHIAYLTEIMIPADASGGSHVLRVRTNWNISSADPCATYDYGETEDYTVNITAGTLLGNLWAVATDQVSGDPVEGAEVQLQDTEYLGFTEEEGICFMDDMVPGSYDIQISKFGFETVQIEGFYIYGTGLNTLEVELVPLISETQNILIPEGWSGLSGYLMLDDPDLFVAMGNISNQLIILQNYEGMFWPAQQVYTLQTWGQHAAYKIKVSNEALLGLSGYMESNLTCSLNAGWTLLPVICRDNVPVPDLFGSMEGDLVIVKDVAGTGIYWPEMSINSLGVLVPGGAYQVLMDNPGSVTFPESPTKADFISGQPIDIIPESWNRPTTTASSHVIAFAEGLWQESSFEKGDILGAFTHDGICAGLARISQNTSITIFADDPLSEMKDGFSEDELFEFKIFKSENDEIFPVGFTWDISKPDHDGVFHTNGLSVATSIKSGPSGIQSASVFDVSIFPNPTDGKVTILGLVPGTEIIIFDSHGRKILNDKSVAETIQLDLSWVQEGIYYIRITSKDGILIEKIVVY